MLDCRHLIDSVNLRSEHPHLAWATQRQALMFTEFIGTCINSSYACYSWYFVLLSYKPSKNKEETVYHSLGTV